MSACSWQAVSHVGCRDAVASSAKISLPEASAAAVPFILRRKSSISARVGAVGVAVRFDETGLSDISSSLVFCCSVTAVTGVAATVSRPGLSYLWNLQLPISDTDRLE